jgi:multicomponent Na+:H+ antiporter subunit G
MLREIVAMALLLFGTLFMLVASLGVLRMPDLYTRMSASAKASTFGIGMILVAALVWFPDAATKAVAVVAIAFMFLSNPVGAHMIGRAAYLVGVPLWEGTIVDEMRPYAAAPGPEPADKPQSAQLHPPEHRRADQRDTGNL